MGRNSGGVLSSTKKGATSYQKTTDALYAAIEGKSKAGVVKAKAKLSALISKMSDAVVKERAESTSSAAYFSHKSNTPKSEYSATAYNYNKTMSQLYNKEARRRKLI